MSVHAVADHMQRKALECGFCYVSREQAIIEFMVVNWAWYCDRNGGQELIHKDVY